MTYNLLNEQWIPVIRRDGRADRVGITSALAEANEIRQIAASNPIDNIAVFRLLLAVLHWCKPQPTQEELAVLRDESTRGIPLEWLSRRLEAAESAFDLLGEPTGFYQSGLDTEKRLAVTNLLHDLPSATNIAHFAHTRDGVSVLCLRCCALGLTRWSAVASAGKAGPTSQMTASIHGNTPAYAVHVGTTLLATILNSWPFKLAPVSGDAPAWDGATEDSTLGISKVLTWQSRRIQLHISPEADGDERNARCCNCGEAGTPLIREISFRPGWERPGKNPWLDDPHLLRVQQTPSGKSKFLRETTPSWPSPNEPLENHVVVWRTVARGNIQRILCRLEEEGQGGGEYETSLLANSQQLYKHAATVRTKVPKFRSREVLQILLDELGWMEGLSERTIAAQAERIREAPRQHQIVSTLYRENARGVALRSTLCGLGPTVEQKLEAAFWSFAEKIADAAEIVDPCVGAARSTWKSEVFGLIEEHLRRATGIVVSGSPLRRLEAERLAKLGLSRAARGTQ